MPSLISDIEKQHYESARDNVFDTFSRPFIAFKTPEKIIINSDLDYKYSYGGPDGEENEDFVEYIPESREFNACIFYSKELELLFANNLGNRGEDLRLTMKEGLVRLKIKQDDWNFLKDAIDYEFDGYKFDKYKVERPHGLFAPKYFTLYLQFKN